MNKYKDIAGDTNVGQENENNDGDQDTPPLPGWSNKCEVPFLAWTKCMQKHTEWYDSYFQKLEDDHRSQKQIDNESISYENENINDDNIDNSREAWEVRISNLESVVNKTMGSPEPFSNDFMPEITIDKKNASGLVVFPMQIGAEENIIVGFVRDNEGQLLGVGQRVDLERVYRKGAMEFGGISGLTEYVIAYAIYEGKGGPLLFKKVFIE